MRVGWPSFKDFNTLTIPKDSMAELESLESKANT